MSNPKINIVIDGVEHKDCCCANCEAFDGVDVNADYYPTLNCPLDWLEGEDAYHFCCSWWNPVKQPKTTYIYSDNYSYTYTDVNRCYRMTANEDQLQHQLQFQQQNQK